MKALEDFLRPTQEELFAALRRMYKGRSTACRGGYILVHGEAPVMLLAHLDTVHRSPVREICVSQDGSILMSPQGIGGDDRCGVYALVAAYAGAEAKPWLLFTCDEEAGCLGAYRFRDMHRKGRLPKELDGLKMLVEIDRKGKYDAVYYDCRNPEFEAYITKKGFRTAWGSFSDISVIAPELGVAAVNLSSGYHDAHTLHEWIDRRQLDAVVRKVAGIIADAAKPGFPRYRYIERPDLFGRWGTGGHGIRKAHAVRKGPKGADGAADGKPFGAVPGYIQQDYEALLDYYTERELEDLRMEYGDHIIQELYESELGYSCSRHEWESLESMERGGGHDTEREPW